MYNMAGMERNVSTAALVPTYLYSSTQLSSEHLLEVANLQLALISGKTVALILTNCPL